MLKGMQPMTECGRLVNKSAAQGGAALCRKEGGAPPLSRVAGLPWCGAADPAIQEESGNPLNECLTQNNF